MVNSKTILEVSHQKLNCLKGTYSIFKPSAFRFAPKNMQNLVKSNYTNHEQILKKGVNIPKIMNLTFFTTENTIFLHLFFGYFWVISSKTRQQHHFDGGAFGLAVIQKLNQERMRFTMSIWCIIIYVYIYIYMLIYIYTYICLYIYIIICNG